MTETLTNGRKAWDTFWRITQTIIATGLIGLFILLWNLNAKVAVIEATMVTEHELITTLHNNIPPDWLRDQVNRIDQQLHDHVSQTTERAHGGQGSGEGSD